MDKIHSIKTSKMALSVLFSNYCRTYGSEECIMELFQGNDFRCPFTSKTCYQVSDSDWSGVLDVILDKEVKVEFK